MRSGWVGRGGGQCVCWPLGAVWGGLGCVGWEGVGRWRVHACVRGGADAGGVRMEGPTHNITPSTVQVSCYTTCIRHGRYLP